jgi:hypothetical protein
MIAQRRRFLDLPARSAQNDAKAREVNMFKDLLSLQRRVALVTGGSRGIGKMIAGSQGAGGIIEAARRARRSE